MDLENLELKTMDQEPLDPNLSKILDILKDTLPRDYAMGMDVKANLEWDHLWAGANKILKLIPTWINIEDQQPKTSQCVLVPHFTDEDDPKSYKVYEAVYNDKDKNGTHEFYIPSLCSVGTFKHWQPLPPPPKK